MGIPVVAFDIGGPYTHPTGATASFPMLFGSSTTFISGRSVMLVGLAITAGGPIIAGTLFTTVSFIEGRPVYLSGAVTALATGWTNGVLLGIGAANTLID